MKDARVTVRLDFAGGRQLGHGKIRLLELIDEMGSISSAARMMKMSYRRAWLLADEVNKMFAEAVLETQLGGKGGGHARLTAFGRRLVSTYRSIEANAEQNFSVELDFLARALTGGTAAGSD